MNSSQEKNYYELLGLESDCSTDQIKDAYREIARVFHPDSNFYDEILNDALPKESMDTFKLITEAYTILSNPQKRRAYDDSLPKNIYGWEKEEKDDLREWANDKAAKRPSWTCENRFGSGVFQASELRGEDSTNVTSVADIIRQRKGLAHRILHIFGLA